MQTITLDCAKCGGTLDIASDSELLKCVFMGKATPANSQRGLITVDQVYPRISGTLSTALRERVPSCGVPRLVGALHITSVGTQLFTLGLCRRALLAAPNLGGQNSV